MRWSRNIQKIHTNKQRGKNIFYWPPERMKSRTENISIHRVQLRGKEWVSLLVSHRLHAPLILINVGSIDQYRKSSAVTEPAPVPAHLPVSKGKGVTTMKVNWLFQNTEVKLEMLTT